MREMEEGPSLGTEGVVRGTHSEHTHTLTEGDERERVEERQTEVGEKHWRLEDHDFCYSWILKFTIL